MRTKRSLRNRRARRQSRHRKHRGGDASSSKLWFISYGNEKFESAKKRIEQEAKDMGCFNGGIKMFGPNDLDVDFNTGAVADVLKQSRGGGFWVWKPYIVMEMLKQVGDNDIILYSDAGCTLQVKGVPRLKEYADMISPTSGKSVLAMRLRDQVAKKWITGAIFDNFGISLDDTIANSNQVLGGVNMFRKCPEAMAVVQRWLDVAKEHPDLFTDEHNEEAKKTNPEFIENRHDQSIFTLIVQTPPSAEHCILIDEEIEATSEPKRSVEFFNDKPVVATRKTSG